MCVIRHILFFLSCVFLSMPVVAQESPQRDARAVAILQQSLSVMGGDLRSTVQDLHVRGLLNPAGTISAPSGVFEAKVRGSDFRMMTTANGKARVFTVFRGSGSVGFEEKKSPLPPQSTSGRTLDVLPNLGRWTEFTRADATISPPDGILFNGKASFLIRVDTTPLIPSSPSTESGYGRSEVIVDESTGLISAVRYKAPLGWNPGLWIQIENRYLDYIYLGGFVLPTRTERYVNGVLQRVLLVQEVKTNNGFTDTDFLK